MVERGDIQKAAKKTYSKEMLCYIHTSILLKHVIVCVCFVAVYLLVLSKHKGTEDEGNASTSIKQIK